ncbi:hypothetical protein HK098_002271 [Nowakowskiella sp. JEL0407]|nr:hypothetical protein HK098_002271 [Nowakowskiella sp. JEL0407]
MSSTPISPPAADVQIYNRKLRSARLFILNRLAKLNALNLNMINQMYPQLEAWEDSDLSKVIILMAPEGSRAYCAGGDVEEVVSLARTDTPAALKFFEEEYKLNHLIGTLNKPLVAIINGITMGGGAGISVHAPFCIATEKTVFAMPESGIGYFPDVGASYFLPKLDGELGTYLGVTGETIKGKDVFISGIASHFINSAQIPDLVNRLADLESADMEVVNSAIEEFAVTVKKSDFESWSLGGMVMEALNQCFQYNTLEEIVAELERHIKDGVNEKVRKWADDTLKLMKERSIISMKVALEALRQGRKKSFVECLQQDYHLAQTFLEKSEFAEGVSAVLVQKKKRHELNWGLKWEDMSNLSVSQIREFYFRPRIASPFAKSRPLLTINRDLDHFDYPHRTLSKLPTELDVYRVVVGRARRGRVSVPPTTKKEVLQYMLLHWGGYDADLIFSGKPKVQTITIEGGFGRGKMGLKEKVEVILDKRCEETERKLEWIGPIPLGGLEI